MGARLLLLGTCFRWHRKWMRKPHAEVAPATTVPVVLGRAVGLIVVSVAFLRTVLAVPGRSTSSLCGVRVTIGIARGPVLAAAAAAGSSATEPYTAGSSRQSCLQDSPRRSQQRSSEQGVGERRLAWTPSTWTAQSCVARAVGPPAWSSPPLVSSCPLRSSPLASSSYHLRRPAIAAEPVEVSPTTG